jgi:Xaa-Pro aminopeptidase
VNATSTDRIVVGVVVTVEPGVYRGPLGGARVEDTVLVTSDGCRPLTKTPKDLACLPSARTTSRTG